MNALARLFFLAGMLGLVLVVAAMGLPQWASRLGCNFWDMRDFLGWIEHEQRRSAELEAESAVVQARLAVKAAILVELRDRQITLLDAAVKFRELNESMKGDWRQLFRDCYPGQSLDEMLCRNVIQHAASRGEGAYATRAQAFTRRLQAELDDHLRRHGEVRLPR